MYSSFEEVNLVYHGLYWAILFNFYISDLFLVIKQANIYNYADENTLTHFSKIIPDLVSILEKENGVALY